MVFISVRSRWSLLNLHFLAALKLLVAIALNERKDGIFVVVKQTTAKKAFLELQ